ncbi:MAG: hypothetical protein ACQXXF_07425, partial [Thermoplasmatota archaeon]
KTNGNNIYYFRYKATDSNYNIAPIESIKMYVIAYPFDFNLTYAFTPKDEETYDLMILATTSRSANCTYQLSPDIDSNLDYSTFGKYASSFTALFTGTKETSFNAVFTCYDEFGNEIVFSPNSFTISYVKDKLINITIDTPYHQDSTPIVSWGNYPVGIKAVPEITINNISVSILKDGKEYFLK